MEKIFIFCLIVIALLVLLTILWDFFEIFKRDVIYFLLLKTREPMFSRIFCNYQQKSVNTYLKDKYRLKSHIVFNFFNSDTRKMVQEIRGLDHEKIRLAKLQKYEESCRLRVLRNEKINELLVRLGNSQF